jgi:hypothetical protein
VEDLERRTPRAECLFERHRVAIASQVKQRVIVAENILYGAPVGEPHMWDAYTGAGMGRVAAVLPFGDVTRLIGNQGRIGISSFDANHAMHAAVVDDKGGGQLLPQRLASGCVVVYLRPYQSPPDRHTRGRPAGGVAVAQSDGAAFLLVCIEQPLTTPAIDHPG